MIIDAVGTTPMAGDFATDPGSGSAGAGRAVSLIATMPSTYEVVRPGDTAFSSEYRWGISPGSETYFGAVSSSAMLSGSRNSRM
ncbi:hypothetical protein GCM10009632_48390 [Mycolicibacterium alvei]